MGYWIVRPKGHTEVEYYMGGGRWSDDMYQAKTFDEETANELINAMGGDVYLIVAI